MTEITQEQAEELKVAMTKHFLPAYGRHTCDEMGKIIDSMTEPVPEPKFKVRDFVVTNEDTLILLGEPKQIKEMFGYSKDGFHAYRCVDNHEFELPTREIKRYATDADWIVEKDGVKWRANTTVDEWIWVSYHIDNYWYHINSDTGIKEYHNKAMAQICQALEILIKRRT